MGPVGQTLHSVNLFSAILQRKPALCFDSVTCNMCFADRDHALLTSLPAHQIIQCPSTPIVFLLAPVSQPSQFHRPPSIPEILPNFVPACFMPARSHRGTITEPRSIPVKTLPSTTVHYCPPNANPMDLLSLSKSVVESGLADLQVRYVVIRTSTIRSRYFVAR